MKSPAARDWGRGDLPRYNLQPVEFNLASISDLGNCAPNEMRFGDMTSKTNALASRSGNCYGAAEICRDLSLYDGLQLLVVKGGKPEPTGLDEVLTDLRMTAFRVDLWCTGCGKEAPFQSATPAQTLLDYRRKSSAMSISASPSSTRPISPWLQIGHFVVQLICQRNTSHRYDYFFEFSGSALFKAGQYPSLEDIAQGDLGRFRKLLKPDLFSDLHRAGGLHSCGIGIGAFVYLRRVFERLILDAQERANEKGASVDVSKLHMDQAISALATELPKALLENKSVWGILSKAVHELDEKTCNAYFPIVRGAILLILEQDLERQERTKREADLKIAISRIAGSHDKPSEPEGSDK